MTATHKPTRVRSPAYPTIDLQTALEKIRTMHDFTHRTPVLVSTMLPHWGYESGKSANGMKVVAALKSYGLISDSGKKDTRKIQLTDNAYRIVHLPESNPERQELTKKFALSPEIYRYMWQTYGPLDAMPQDEAIKSDLVLEKKFNESAVTGFLNDYKDTIRFAKIGAADTVDPTDTCSDGNSGVDDETGEQEKRLALGEIVEAKKGEKPPNPATIGANSTKLPPVGETMRQETFTLDTGEVTIQWPSEMTKESFEDFQDWLKILERKIGRAVVATTDGLETASKTDE